MPARQSSGLARDHEPVQPIVRHVGLDCRGAARLDHRDERLVGVVDAGDQRRAHGLQVEGGYGTDLGAGRGAVLAHARERVDHDLEVFRQSARMADGRDPLLHRCNVARPREHGDDHAVRDLGAEVDGFRPNHGGQHLEVRLRMGERDVVVAVVGARLRQALAGEQALHVGDGLADRAQHRPWREVHLRDPGRHAVADAKGEAAGIGVGKRRRLHGGDGRMPHPVGDRANADVDGIRGLQRHACAREAREHEIVLGEPEVGEAAALHLPAEPDEIPWRHVAENEDANGAGGGGHRNRPPGVASAAIPGRRQRAWAHFMWGASASRRTGATASMPGVSEWMHTVSTRMGTSMPSTDVTMPSSMARSVRLAAAAGS